MKTLAITFVISLFFFANFPQRAFAQERPPDAIYIIFDASGSMWGKLPDKTTKRVDTVIRNAFIFVSPFCFGYFSPSQFSSKLG